MQLEEIAMSEELKHGPINQDLINNDRRRFMRNAAMTLAAAEFVAIGSAVAQPGRKNAKEATAATSATNVSSHKLSDH